ncbi:TLDD - like protein [Thermococcus chitonophagus]|uniref:TLDD-like protein n=1 Tax=Thermococcus chitonophagus TaxID=54262 RepID=A0A160VRE9_9EURY|nr:TldD/PmbA family protein [Thermococcus chitonophagus]ASJ15916.1 TLDD - like protein [Thermococcus chitonophagus]CUX77159.1 TldD protein, part of TldE/TldD proteolytic complex [Thermococcus chitonophagus]
MEIEKMLRLIQEYSEKYGAKFIDVRIEETQFVSIAVENGKVEEFEANQDFSIGVRALINGWGFSSTTDARNFEETLKVAIKLAKVSRADTSVYTADPVHDSVRIKEKIPISDVSLEEKLEFSLSVNKMLEEENIKTRKTFYSDSIVRKVYLSSEGSLIETVTPRVMVGISVIAKSNGIMQNYWKYFGGTQGWELINSVDFGYWTDRVVKKARELLSAKSPPSGKLPVIMDPELTGVFIHEALGHAVEADSVKSGESILAGMLGKKIAVDTLTVIDDPTIPGKFGSYVYDDEGIRGRKVEIIKDGVLMNYLNDRETSAVLGLEPNGHGRAQNASHVPLVRMSNTYVAPSDWTFEEMLEEVKFGVYMIGDKGGQVDITNGSFMFGAKEGYIIRNGEIVEMVRDVALSGSILETLKAIKAIGNDLRVEFPGFCGKGQWVPVDDGGPHVLTEAVVGGLE